jgi:DNA invertase Pin-like site-specific DNA recombinase
MKRTVIYCRTAAQEQVPIESYGLQAQRASCLNYCIQEELEVVEILAEVAIGISLNNRPKLDELRQMVRSGRVDIVVVHCFDRLARNNELLVGLICEFESFGVESFGVVEHMTGFDAIHGPTAAIREAMEQIGQETIQRRRKRQRAR